MGPNTYFFRVILEGGAGDNMKRYELVPDKEIKRVVFCSGKVFYEMWHARSARKIRNIVFVRLEQVGAEQTQRVVSCGLWHARSILRAVACMVIPQDQKHCLCQAGAGQVLSGCEILEMLRVIWHALLSHMITGMSLSGSGSSRSGSWCCLHRSLHLLTTELKLTNVFVAATSHDVQYRLPRTLLIFSADFCTFACVCGTFACV